MGGSTSKLEKALGQNFPESEKIFGLENFGNTCYCNSVLQALYFCQPFRRALLDYAAEPKNLQEVEGESHLLSALAELFSSIATQKKRTGVVAPKRFIQKLRKENELFRGFMHQDAHEFLNFLLNTISETLEKQQKSSPPVPNEAIPASLRCSEGKKTWIHEIFEGTLTNETKCLSCETVTSKQESFLDLSIDVEQNTSLTHCLKNFSSTETLCHRDKFFCDQCCSLQEAQKRMRIKKLPKVLALHLKRFKYVEHLQRHKKLTHRVVFPMELKVANLPPDDPDSDSVYELFAIVVHAGSGPNHGHYICIVKSHNQWLLFDDDNVDVIEESQVQTVFGSSSDIPQNTNVGYILFYQSESASPTSLSGYIDEANQTQTGYGMQRPFVRDL